MSEFSFVKEMDWKDYFNETELSIIEVVGIDKFLLLLERHQKSSFYFSTERIEIMKKDFILKNKKLGIKELMRRTRFSESHIYAILRNSNEDNYKLFDED